MEEYHGEDLDYLTYAMLGFDGVNILKRYYEVLIFKLIQRNQMLEKKVCELEVERNDDETY